MAVIREPRRMNPLLRVGVTVAERVTGRRMQPARLLAWYPVSYTHLTLPTSDLV